MKILKLIFVNIFLFVSVTGYSQVRVHPTGSNTVPYNTWATAATNLQTAMNYANANAIPEVWVAAGTYTNGASFALRNNVTVYGGFPNVGNPVFGDRDYIANVTIMSGANVRRVIRNSNDGVNATAIVDGIRIQSGQVNGQGAGGYFRNTSPTFVNCTFLGNNTGGGQDGGALYLIDAVTSTFTNCIFDTNVAGDDGGALFVNNGGCNPVFTSCIFNNNQSTDDGGAVWTEDGSPRFIACTFSNNTANDLGGAFRINSGLPIIHRSLLYGNNANNQGGAFHINGGTPSIYTSVIRNNTATTRGGGIFTNTTAGNFLNNVIYANSADLGGGFSTNSNDDPRFRSTIFWGNTATTAGDQIYLDDTGCDPYFSYCCVEGGIAAFGGAGSGGQYAAARYSNCIEVDPQFVNAPGNDFHLTMPGSPCIGAGDPTTTGLMFPTDEDMDGEKRVRGVVDIGAYETNNPPTIVTGAGVDNPGPENVVMDEDGVPTAFNLTLFCLDPDNEDITWTISTPATNGVAAPATGLSTNTSVPTAEVINYTPNPDYNGADVFIVQISDGTFTDQIQVNVTINSISDPPSFTSTPVLTGKSGQLYTYNIIVTDPDLPPEVLTITCPTQPAWLGFVDNGNRTGSLSGIPGDLDAGLHNVVLEVFDGTTTVQQIFTINVSDRFIYVDWAGGGDFLTIQEGIDAAVAGDKVIVSAGTYNENINTNGKSIEIEGDPASPANVTIDGGSSGSVITIDQGGTPTINGFTVTNGSGSLGLPVPVTLHAPSAAYYGGGVFCYNSDPTLSNLIIENNTLSVTSNNGGSGAGIYIGNSSTATIDGVNTIIRNNSSGTYRGGGVCIDDSDVTITGISVNNNYSGNYGGGIAVYNSVLNLNAVSITGNTVDGPNGRGGGLYDHTSQVNIIGGSIAGNSASTAGNNRYSFY